MDYETRKQLKIEEEQKRERTRAIKKFAKIALPAIVLVGGGIWLSQQIPANTLQANMIAEDGIHWHANLSIMIKGEKQEIPANIGLGAVHNPIHTHETDGVIHLEFNGKVREQDTKLGVLFRNWNKQFSGECIFNSCNGAEGTVSMTVNGNKNTDFENYLMRDGDNIEIRFE